MGMAICCEAEPPIHRTLNLLLQIRREKSAVPRENLVTNRWDT